jgi:GntR family transcriptional repressor for pyruvate dehydrogenase complex
MVIVEAARQAMTFRALNRQWHLAIARKITLVFKAANKRRKVSHYVVEQIRTAILTGQFKPGDKLASEKELTDQFQVSKASMREAIRVLEVMGLIEIRSGINGGIFAAEVDMHTTTNSLTNFLHFKNVSIRDITMFRYLLEPPLARIAASKVTETDIERLRGMTDEEVANQNQEDPKGIGFHRDIARYSENPLLILLMDFTESLLVDIKIKLQPGGDFYDEVARDHYNILEAFRKKDGTRARKAMADHVIRVGDHLARLGREASFKPTDVESDGHRNLEIDCLQSLFQLKRNGEPNSPVEKVPSPSSLVLKHVGTGELYLVELTGKGPSD